MNALEAIDNALENIAAKHGHRDGDIYKDALAARVTFQDLIEAVRYAVQFADAYINPTIRKRLNAALTKVEGNNGQL